MLLLNNAIIRATRQHPFDMPKAIALPGAIHSREKLAGKLSCIGKGGGRLAIIAIAALVGRALPKMPQQDGASAPPSFDKRPKRREAGTFPRQATLLHVSQPLARADKIF